VTSVPDAPNPPSGLLTDGATNPNNVSHYAPTFSWSFSDADTADAFFAGKCQAFASDAAQLAAARLRGPGGPRAFVILPERISREPVGPAVRQGDDDWFTLVRWVLFMLIIAEEQGITSANVEAVAAESRSASWRLGTGRDAAISQALGVRPDWAVQAIRAVGNYGEVFERNLGSNSMLGIERGLNRLWSEGGLLYAPPVD